MVGMPGFGPEILALDQKTRGEWGWQGGELRYSSFVDGNSILA